jgi:hypothetical protein
VQGPWIKLEVSLYEDPRTRLMAHRLHEQLLAKYGAELPVNMLWITCVGAVGKLWTKALVHVDEHDIMAFGPADIDEFTGLQGFCDLVPAEWLQVLDAHHVKLPGFHAHNGTQARKKLNGLVRQQRHRNTRALPKRQR